MYNQNPRLIGLHCFELVAIKGERSPGMLKRSPLIRTKRIASSSPATGNNEKVEL